MHLDLEAAIELQHALVALDNLAASIATLYLFAVRRERET
jgi:hypothetical protein